MKNKYILAGVIALVGLTASVQAIPITGTIQLGGTVQFNTTSLQSATIATFPVNDIQVSSGSGSYTGTAGAAPVTFNTFNFSSTGLNTVSPLWSFVWTGKTYQFNLESITTVSRQSFPNGSDQLFVGGFGKVSITGFDTTAANWSFNVTDSSGGNGGIFLFAFNDSNTAIPASVPDGGTTVMLIGAALSGLGLIRKKLVA
ncbi:MAG: hypothetical protein ABI042_03725 [Verrucomicrobiota bacterium]